MLELSFPHIERYSLLVLSIITSGNTKEEAGVNSISDGIIDSLLIATPKTHIDDDAIRAAPGPGVLDGIVDSSNDIAPGARATCVKDLDAVKFGRLGYAVGVAANSASTMGAVAVVVSCGTGA